MKKSILVPILLGLTILLSTSCNSTSGSQDDRLQGDWMYCFDSHNPYTENRAFSKDGPDKTFMHKLYFEVEDKKRGKFKDDVLPLWGAFSNQKWFIGSAISGEWETKGNKLYLYYNDDFQLVNAKSLSDEEKDQIFQVWNTRFNDWKKLGEHGYPYEIIEKNGIDYLKIHGLPTPTFAAPSNSEK